MNLYEIRVYYNYTLTQMTDLLDETCKNENYAVVSVSTDTGPDGTIYTVTYVRLHASDS